MAGCIAIDIKGSTVPMTPLLLLTMTVVVVTMMSVMVVMMIYLHAIRQMGMITVAMLPR
jgi:hypothetical protein